MLSLSKIVFVSLVVLCNASFAVNAEVKIAYLDTPPYAFHNADQEPSGLLIDAFREIVDEVGLEARFVHLPHRRLIDFIERGEIDIWAGQDNSRVNNELALVSQHPLFLMDLYVYWREGAQPKNTLDDLKNQNLVLISSYSYGGNFSNLVKHSKHTEFAINHEDGFEKLFMAQSQYLLGYKKISEAIIDKFKIVGVKGNQLAQYKLYLKVSKSTPNAIEIMKKADALLLQKHLQSKS